MLYTRSIIILVKKHIMRLFVHLFAVIVLVSCNNKCIIDTDYAMPNFERTYTAEVKTIKSGYLYEPILAMYLWKDYLIVKAKSAENKFEFQVLSKNDGSQITGFGFIGRGDNELTLFNNIGFNPQSGYISAIDFNGKFALYNVDKIINSKNPNPEKCYNMPTFPKGKVRELNGGLIHLESIPRIFMTDMTGQDTICVIRNVPSVSPEIDKDTIDHQMYYVHSSNWASRPDGKKLCNVTRNGMIMEIYDIDGRSITPIVLRYFFKPEMSHCRSGRAEDNCVWGTTKVSTTNKYIYCHYSDSTRDVESNDYVAVFDWNGREKCRYKLPKRTYDFVVTPDDKRCYIWSHDVNGEENLGYFDMN